jgi:hypothetical protein
MLKTKRAEIAGRIDSLQLQIRELTIDLDSLDASICIFDPTTDVKALRRSKAAARRQPGTKRVNMSRLVLTTLRETGKPLTTRDLAQHIMAATGTATSDHAAVKATIKQARACVQRFRKRGTVRSMAGPNEFKLSEERHA